MKEHRINKSSSSTSDLIASLTILFNTFTWFYMLRAVINTVLQDQNNISFFVIFDSAVIFSSIFGAFIARKTKRAYIIYFWITLGVITSLLTAFLDITLIENLSVIALFFGFSFGLGIPSGLAYFADCTMFENRGRNSGFLFMISNLGGFLFLITLGENLFWILIVASIWRTTGLITLILIRPRKIEGELKVYSSFKSILSNRSFILYIVPWLLFCLVDSIEKPYFISLARISGVAGEKFIAFDEVLEPLIGTIFAFISGFVADQIGRKKVVLYGFIALGITFAALSLAPTMQAFWYVTSAIDGIAWGVFYVMFVLVLWGDLSPSNDIREKYFALGGIPFFFAELLGKVVYPFAQEISIQTVNAAFPLASFFLFLAVVPLMYAPETLPEKKIRERELKRYIEKAKKIKEKYVKE